MFSSLSNISKHFIDIFSVDQLLFAPVFIGVLIGSIGLLQGNKPNDVRKKLQREFPEILTANYKLWYKFNYSI
jgi:hypothetical protein